MNSIGERIRIKRKELGLTLKQVYDETGISTGNLSDIERGKYVPSSFNLSKLATLLKCSVDWILNGDTEISNTEISNISEDEKYILSLYNQLTDIDKKELQELMEFKIFKRRELEKSSISATIENVNEIA